MLEFVEGESLRDLLEDTGAVSERLAREIGANMAHALAALHEIGVVHRDVKPENVVISPDERIKLMDLGLAFVQEEALRLTQTGVFVGSLLYAAPEQLRGDPVDARTDLFGLGLVLFELLTGHLPARAEKGLGPHARHRPAGRRGFARWCPRPRRSWSVSWSVCSPATPTTASRAPTRSRRC